MISFPANTDIFVCHQPVSFGCGIDGMIRYCKIMLKAEPLSKAYFMFINKNKQQIRVLWYDGQGFLLCTKRSSKGSFLNWPTELADVSSIFTFFDAHVLFSGGDPRKAEHKSIWKKVA